jgi:Protein of unknown function (DUF5661)/Family of unknown function (DUF6064)
MALPFTFEQFFRVFTDYNRAVWPAQLGLFVLGVVLVLLAYRGRTGVIGVAWLWYRVRRSSSIASHNPKEVVMAAKRQFSAAEAREIGTRLAIDWAEIDLEQLRRGLEVELEHGARDPQTNVTNDDVDLTAKIAWAHLREIRDYYTRLDAMEAAARAFVPSA